MCVSERERLLGVASPGGRLATLLSVPLFHMRVALCRLPGALAPFVSLRVSFASSQGAVMRAAARSLIALSFQTLPLPCPDSPTHPSLPLSASLYPAVPLTLQPHTATDLGRTTRDAAHSLGQMDLIPVQNITYFSSIFLTCPNY